MKSYTYRCHSSEPNMISEIFGSYNRYDISEASKILPYIYVIFYSAVNT